MHPYTPSLRRVKSIFFDSIDDNKPTMTRTGKIRPFLTVDIKNPKEDYIYLKELQLNQGTLVCKQNNYLQLAVIRESFSPKPLQMLKELAKIRHSNIADIKGAYFYEGKLDIVAEHLEVSLFDLEFDTFAPEEWEIATIIAEIMKAMIYLSDASPACTVRIDSVRLSLQGDVKLILDMHYQNLSNEYTLSGRYSSEFLVGTLKALMSYGTPSDSGWSPAAIDFSSISSSQSLTHFANHVFMTNALSPYRLIPRIRLATHLIFCQ